MTASTRIVVVLAAFLSGLLVFLGVIYFVTGHGPGSQANAAIGGPFSLVDQDGRLITEQEFKGKPFLIFFGYTHCPDVCPTTLFDMSELMRALGPDADRTGAVFITVDPERDTPAVMKDYLSSFDPHVRGLTGDAAQVAAAEKAYRVYQNKVPTADGGYTMDHTALVYLMDKQGRFVAPFSLRRKPDETATELRKYL
ncbi:MAG: SCO family protein [Pseudolabrys sp.]